MCWSRNSNTETSSRGHSASSDELQGDCRARMHLRSAGRSTDRLPETFSIEARRQSVEARGRRRRAGVQFPVPMLCRACAGRMFEREIVHVRSCPSIHRPYQIFVQRSHCVAKRESSAGEAACGACTSRMNGAFIFTAASRGRQRQRQADTPGARAATAPDTYTCDIRASKRNLFRIKSASLARVLQQ